jgi:hypothetical protein
MKKMLPSPPTHRLSWTSSGSETSMRRRRRPRRVGGTSCCYPPRRAWRPSGPAYGCWSGTTSPWPPTSTPSSTGPFSVVGVRRPPVPGARGEKQWRLQCACRYPGLNYGPILASALCSRCWHLSISPPDSHPSGALPHGFPRGGRLYRPNPRPDGHRSRLGIFRPLLHLSWSFAGVSCAPVLSRCRPAQDGLAAEAVVQASMPRTSRWWDRARARPLSP